MSAHVLVSGTLFRAPEQKVSKSGKPFVVATIRAKDGEASQWWKIIVFSESAGAELLRLADGDAVSVQGALRVETYTKDGETRINLTCIADAVMALRQPPKQRSKKEPTQDTHSRRVPNAADADLNDTIPF